MAPRDANSHLVGITLMPLFVFQFCMVHAQINGFFAFSLELNRNFVLLKKLGFYKWCVSEVAQCTTICVQELWRWITQINWFFSTCFLSHELIGACLYIYLGDNYSKFSLRCYQFYGLKIFFCLFEIRKIAVCFLWHSLPGHYRVNDEALLAETT